MSAVVTFTTELARTGAATTGVVIPPDVLAELGAGVRPAVVATINDYVYRTTVGVMKGTAMLPFSAQHRNASGIEGGDRIRVELRVDTESRTVEVPDDLKAALSADRTLEAAFAKQAPSRLKADVEAVLGARTGETRARRIQAIVVRLRS